MSRTTRASAAVSLTVAGALSLAACGGSASPASTSAATAASGGVDLAGVCPKTVVVQTDWNPEAEHGHLYELLAPEYTVDADQKSVTSDLYSQGKPTGVKIEIRAGGPAIGFQTVSSQMYADKSITLGYVNTDQSVQFSGKLPTTAVFAENQISPQIIMWDPETYPGVTDIKGLGAELQKNGGVVRYFNGATYMSYLEGSGMLPKAILDGGYDGTPAKFVAAKGKDAQQGFATAEPYVYEKEVGAWGKPVKFQLIHEAGYPIYPEAMSVRTGDLKTLSPCLKKLVPVLQQADVDFIGNPARTNKAVVDLVTQYNNGWVYSEAVADFAVKQMKALQIAANGPSGYVGEMTEERVQKIIDIDTPIFKAQKADLKPGLKPAEIYTNEFLDTSIKF